jgi:hypothetical protein
LLLKLFFGAQVPVEIEILIGYVERMVERERALVLKFTQAGDDRDRRKSTASRRPVWADVWSGRLKMLVWR